MQIPTISVVMSVHNCEPFLREAIESILDQTFRDFEFLIINDGSTDDSRSIMDAYERLDSRIQVYHQEKRGLIDSLNRGCGLARGKYIARMDGDDVAVANRFMWQVEFIEKHPEVAVVGGNTELINANGKSIRICKHPTHNRALQSALLDRCAICHPTVLMRKEVFAGVGGYRKVALDVEDYDLWLRIGDRFQIVNLEDVVLRYRLHPYQVSLRKCERLAVNSLAVRTAAISRRSGNADPLSAAAEITPAVLAGMGVSEEAQRATLARISLTFARNMYQAGEAAPALAMLQETLRSADWRFAEKWIIADLRLLAARLYWQRREFRRSIGAAAHAIITWPKMIGRPAKPLLRWLQWSGA